MSRAATLESTTGQSPEEGLDHTTQRIGGANDSQYTTRTDSGD